MAGRRKRKKHIFPKIILFLCVIAVAAGAVTAAGWSLPRLFRAVGETVNTAAQPQAEFPELTVSVEEVDGSFYYQQLSEKEQQIYREILQAVQEMQETVQIHAGKDDDAAKVYEYLLYDRPELFWCDGSSQMTVYEEYTELDPGYSCTKAEKEQKQREIDQASEECLAGIGADASEYEKIKYVYEYLVQTVDYDEGAPDNQNIYSALAGKRSVCAGYSRAAQYLLEKMGIACIYVTGNIRGQGAHAWNIVNCEGTYYQMDVTFGDPVFLEAESGESVPHNSINYDYLCCTDEALSSDHIQDDFVPYPVCDSDDLDYYRMNGMYYDSFDADAILRDMNESIYAGEESFVCKFSSDDVYSMARDEVIDELIPLAAENLADIYGLSRVRYTYVDDGTHRRVSVFWDYGESGT
ncbi:MAG TPA: hypothetical protein H9732_02990 [Candidatus Mediterraneibacter avicola]|nr:hypothetical protein [Candidatus Mediterraneibacter avicola]